MKVYQVFCDLCHVPCVNYRFHKTMRVCTVCRLPDEQPSPLLRMKKKIEVKDGIEYIIGYSDRFIWNTFKWYIIDFLEKEKQVVVRLEGTADVAVLPYLLVGRLVKEFSLS